MEVDNKFYFGVLLLLVPAALLAAGKFPYMFLYLTLLAALIPYGRLRKGLYSLRGEISVSDRTREVGQSFAVNYKIINSEAGTFPYLELATVMDSFQSGPLYTTLKPGETKEIEREILCERRGVYSLSALSVKTGDPFGLFKLGTTLADGGEVKVYPRIRTFPEVPLPIRQQAGEHVAKRAVHENHSALAQLRTWQDGDNIKRIHWKQSARQEEIIVKHYERAGDSEFALFVDMHQGSYEQDKDYRLEDLAVELAASLVYHRLQEHQSVLVYSDPTSGGPIKGKKPGDYERVVDQLITLSPKQTGSFFHYLRRQSYFLPANSSLYIITPSLSFEYADLLLSLKRKGFPIVLFLLHLQAINKDLQVIINRMREAGIKVQGMPPAKGGKP